MATNSIHLRRQRYFKLSSQIALMDNARLRGLFEESEASTGWGRNHTVEVGRSKVFVKRVPVTDLEYENMLSTRNLYELPTYYNYGVGSAGLGVFRELVTHIKTTNWVLEGAIATFPLTYHYRIVPRFGERGTANMERHQSYVEYWGSNANIGRYLLDRWNANHELVLFLEHVPHVLEPWLREHPGKLQQALDDLRSTITFLRENGIIHFDAHFHNVLTDGEQAYLTDFGLALDRSFDLTREEAQFYKQHTYYDYGEVLACVDFLVFRAYEALPESEKRRKMEKYGITEGMRHSELLPILLNNIEELHRDRTMRLDKEYVASIVRYRSITLLMDKFYTDMRQNRKKDTRFPHGKLRRLLKETGFVS